MNSRYNLEYFDDVSTSVLELAVQPLRKDELYSHLIQIVSQKHVFISSSAHLRQYISLLRLIGLLKRKYYQTTSLGRFFLELKLNFTSYLKLFSNEFAQLLNRSQTEKISPEQFFQFYIACGKWYIQIMNTRGLSGSEFLVFLSLLRYAFELSDEIPASVEESAQGYLNDFLQEEYRKRISKKGESHFLPQTGVNVQTRNDQGSVFLFSPPSAIQRGRVLKIVLYDIYSWLITSLLNKENRFYAFHYFDISIYAEKANIQYRIPKQNYTRNVRWIIQYVQKHPVSAKHLNYLQNLGSIKDWGMEVHKVVSLIRNHCAIYEIKIIPNKSRQVLAFKSTKEVKKTPLFYNTKLLRHVCEECIYFEKTRKKDCLFFKRLELLNKEGRIGILPEIKALFQERIQPIFSTRTACHFWRSRQPFQISIHQIDLVKACCVYCQLPLPNLSTSKDFVTCVCETSYQYISNQKARNGIFICQLTNAHTIGHDLAILNPLLLELANDPFKMDDVSDQQEIQTFNPEIDSIDDLINRTKHYAYIEENSKVLIESEQHLLKINQNSYDLRLIFLLDSQKSDPRWKKDLFNHIKSFPNLKINFRPFNIILSPEDRATIVQADSQVPILQITRPRKKGKENYSLHQLSVVFNVGKPRLTKLLKQWNVKVIYTSTKGISPSPKEEIREAINLPGVRETLQKLHLQGLLISNVCATLVLSNRIKNIKLDELRSLKRHTQESDLTKLQALADNLLRRMASLLSIGVDDPFNKESSENSSFKRIGLIEARFSRPFSEELRNFIRIIQNENSPFILRGYGRTVARRIKKRQKQGLDYMGGYTRFDAALNCLNRSLRYKLRIWNAKAGLGFHTVPLFVHTSKDKPGRAGHLDLEEVARIISRFALIESILTNTTRSSGFKIGYDDDFLPYYAPTSNTVMQLRYNIIYGKVFQTKVFYQRKWISLTKAHKKHVSHLCSCLKNALKIPNENDRIQFLKSTYHPLIYLPEVASPDQEMLSYFVSLLNPIIIGELRVTLERYSKVLGLMEDFKT